ncbi:Transposon Ty3-I Gag-Pol polyprotein [Dictyocoela roeselum]|nr:Transposon Ty3-I Gag-Pol polyprotein [Dictyocoela roeselum]
MKKFQYFLLGTRFTLITDHKAIEQLKTKLDLGSARIQRWFQRLKRFDFEIKYRDGANLVTADALSRSFFLNNKIMSKTDNNAIAIMDYHVKTNHRKSIQKDLKKINIRDTCANISKILDNCTVCQKKDKKFIRSGDFIKTSTPGEMMAFYILEINKGDLVLLKIDYFSKSFRSNVKKKKMQNL